MKKLLDLGQGYKTYVIGLAMFLHGGSQIILDLVNGKPVDQLNIVEILGGLGLLTGRRAVDR